MHGFGFVLVGCVPHPDAARLQADSAEHPPRCRVFGSGPGESDSDMRYLRIELRYDATPIARTLEYADRRERRRWCLIHRDLRQSHRNAPSKP